MVKNELKKLWAKGIYIGPADLSLGLSQGKLPASLDREESEIIAAISTEASPE